MFLLGGDAIPTRDNRGVRIRGDSLLVLINPQHEAVEFTLPAIEYGLVCSFSSAWRSFFSPLKR